MMKCTNHSRLGKTKIFQIAVLIVFISLPLLAQKASLGQQVAVMKALKPDLKTVGVLSGNMTDKLSQDLTRAGISQSITVVIAKPKDQREVAGLYKKLVSEKKIQMLWLPDGGDEVTSGVSSDYLRENTAMDGVGLCVTEKNLVVGGALCSVQLENGKLTVYVNKKIASVVGVTIPPEGSGITFIAQ